MVKDLHIEAALLIGPLALAGMEFVLTAAHDEQPLIGHFHDIIQ